MSSTVTAIPAYALPSVAAPTQAAKTGSPAQTSAVVAPHASPVSLLDPSTGLVVLEFFNDKGDETASLPTKKQLDLYRLNETSPDIFQPSIRETTELPTQA